MTVDDLRNDIPHVHAKHGLLKFKLTKVDYDQDCPLICRCYWDLLELSEWQEAIVRDIAATTDLQVAQRVFEQHQTFYGSVLQVGTVM